MNQLPPEETKQSEQITQIAPKKSKQPSQSLDNRNIWGFEKDEKEYKNFETEESCKDKFSDEESLIISSISVH